MDYVLSATVDVSLSIAIVFDEPFLVIYTCEVLTTLTLGTRLRSSIFDWSNITISM